MWIKEILYDHDELQSKKSYQDYWKQTTFSYLCVFYLLAGMPMIIIGAVLYSHGGLLFNGIIQAIVYIVVLILVFSKILPMKGRYSAIIYYLMFVSYFLLFTTGPYGTWAILYLLTFFCVGFLFDKRMLIAFIIANALVLTGATIIIIKGIFPTYAIHDYKYTWSIVLVGTIVIPIIILLVVHAAVSAIKEQEVELNQRGEFLKAIMESINSGILITDTQGKIIKANPGFSEVTQQDAACVNGHPIQKVFHVMDEQGKNPFRQMEDVLKSEKGAYDSLDYRRDGELVHLSVRYSTITGNEEKIRGVIFVIQDVTLQKITEERNRQNQKLQALGTLAGGVAHDFNNMLGGIMGYAQLLIKESETVKGSERTYIHKGYVKEIIKTVEKASELTRQLLAYSRKDDVNFTFIDVRQPISSAVRLLNRVIDKRIDIFMNLEQKQHIIYGDSALLQNAFLNICLNARDAMPDGGKLIIESKIVELDDIYCAKSSFDIKQGSYIRLMFMDTGHGIPSESIGHIFEPFYTTKGVGKGTGLGLSEVFGSIVSHNGEIIVHSELDGGTRFIIHLPLGEESGNIQDNVTKGSAVENAVISVKKMRKILLVDDEPVIRHVLEIYLESLGYEVLCADDGEEGIDMYKSFWRDIDVVLVDMLMPKMNGLESFQGMRAINNEVKGIMLSGFMKEEQISRIMEAGFSGYFRKPFDLEAVVQKIEELCENV